MFIKHKFEDTKRYIPKIYKLLKQEPNTTTRSLKYLSIIAKKEYLHLFFNNNDLIGFVISEPIHTNWNEIKSLYVLQKYRKKGIAKKILAKILEKDKKYFAFTFNKFSTKAFETVGFKKTKTQNQNFYLLFKILLTRPLQSFAKIQKSPANFLTYDKNI